MAVVGSIKDAGPALCEPPARCECVASDTTPGISETSTLRVCGNRSTIPDLPTMKKTLRIASPLSLLRKPTQVMV
jgi:hypothetical protein